ncbi:hypothetical protein B9Z55_005562 [Caenorhabditis nigoni]|uniref:Uncharacterized protein n=1 Tax=Caenorhabditis nigoni TaxID=1611254 RepID=A0A2G5V1D6_9PELO|nr:hypothetical protein B9Z55_005562 [Caenorhabditis nigoni]
MISDVPTPLGFSNASFQRRLWIARNNFFVVPLQPTEASGASMKVDKCLCLLNSSTIGLFASLVDRRSQFVDPSHSLLSQCSLTIINVGVSHVLTIHRQGVRIK